MSIFDVKYIILLRLTIPQDCELDLSPATAAQLYPEGLREALALPLPAHLVPAPHPSLTGGLTAQQALDPAGWQGGASFCRQLFATWRCSLYKGCGLTPGLWDCLSSLSGSGPDPPPQTLLPHSPFQPHLPSQLLTLSMFPAPMEPFHKLSSLEMFFTTSSNRP